MHDVESEIQKYRIFSLPELDEHLRIFVPSLFSEIEVVNNEIIVKVPYQVTSKVVNHLRDNYYVNASLKVIGV